MRHVQAPGPGSSSLGRHVRASPTECCGQEASERPAEQHCGPAIFLLPQARPTYYYFNILGLFYGHDHAESRTYVIDANAPEMADKSLMAS